LDVSGPILRPYQPSDFDTLLAMDQLCFPKDIAYGRREMRSYLQSEGSRCMVAEVSGAVAGFILTNRDEEIAHIVTLDVLEPYRRQSVGSLLLQAAEHEAASTGAALMVLETATTNQPAIALWKKHGYRETGTIENYYGRGLNAFEMVKFFGQKSLVKVQP
jgi:ribosomal protein S18 acetylase RimI-like enzyme